MVHFSNRRSRRPDSPAARRADRRRVEILRAAAHVFRTRGFAAAGMREIAVTADLSPGNLYHYFSGKDEILYFCQDRTLDRLLDAAALARAGHGPLPGRLRELAVTHVLCILDQVEGSAAHLEVDALPPRLRTLIVSKRDRYERRVRSLISAGVRRGDLAATDATIATRAFLGALNWTAQWFRPEGAQAPGRVAALVAVYAVAGLINQRGGGRADRAQRQRRAGRDRVRAVQNAARGAA